MPDLTSALDGGGPAAAKPAGSALGVYLRLVGYAWRYKARLLISLGFAVLIAVSFMTMLVSIGTVVNLAFYEVPADAASVDEDANVREDPAIGMARDIRESLDWMRDKIGWAPGGVEERFDSMVARMRAEKTRALSLVCFVVVVLAFVIGVTRFFQEYFAGMIGANISTDLGQAMYENLMRQSVGFFETRASGEILTRFTNDVFMVNRGLAGVFVKLMREPIKAAGFLAMALYIDVWLTLVGIAVLPLVAYVLLRIGKKMRRSVRRSLQKIASMAAVVNETVAGIAIVKGYSMEAYEIGRVRREIVKLRRFLYQMVRLDAATGPVTELMLILGVVAFVLLSARRVDSGDLAAGDLIQLYMALVMMVDPLRKLSSVNNMVQASVASAERVFEFIDLEPEIVEAPDAQAIPPLREALRFEGLRFSYDGETEVLKGIDLTIPRGEMVAFVGFSGAGKSTLAKLIPRFYDVTGGAITIDGVDVREATFKSLRDQIGMVTQETVLFAESIRDNIAFGREAYSAERVREAAVAAHADVFIKELKQGYETVIGESGSGLSGGQRQRLAIARAIIKDPAILILDEATSSLDSQSERLIQEALEEFVEGRTTLVIAHRLSTIQRADRIVVLDGGCIAEQGTHEELLDKGGIYTKLYQTQFGMRTED